MRPLTDGHGKSLLLWVHSDHHESMQVIRHDHKIAEINHGTQKRCLAPLRLNDLAQPIEVHFPILHLTEKKSHFSGAKSNKVLARL